VLTSTACRGTGFWRSLFSACPIFSKISKRDRPGYGKRKIKSAQNELAVKIATVCNIPEHDKTYPVEKCPNCDDFDQLIADIKCKLLISNRQQKIQLLTLTPNRWAIKKAAMEFNVSERLVKVARKLKNSGGILAIPGKKPGKKLSEDVENRVLKIYENDEYGRMCPGKKECISVKIDGVKTQKQKRLMLCNLRELFLEYRKINGPEVGFSKFCELRPQWCITAGPAGTHSVCVCLLHQNVKLMLIASPLDNDYKLLMSKLVCDIESSDCMLRRCDACPGKEALSDFLQETFNEIEIDEIVLKQWVQTDRAVMQTRKLGIEEYQAELCEKNIPTVRSPFHCQASKQISE